MPGPRFRSTAGFAARSRRPAPAVERATFVCFSLGGTGCAAPVEVVERVQRQDSHGTRSAAEAHLRELVLRLGDGQVVAAVDAVHEVVTIDASAITAVSPAQRAELQGCGVPALPEAARGVFMRHARAVFVVDVARLFGPGRAEADDAWPASVVP